jgi:hypothetical protein
MSGMGEPCRQEEFCITPLPGRGLRANPAYPHPATFDMITVAQGVGHSVPNIMDLVRYNMVNLTVDQQPPADYSYCNYNYQVLVVWCMIMTRLNFDSLLQKYVLSRMPSRDLVQSRAMWGLRHPREVVRYDPGMAADGPTAYDCTRTASPLLTTSVTTGGNSFVEEAAIGSSGLIASTNSLCDYADHFDIDGNYTTSPAGGYSFYGEFTGTNCGLVWQSGVTRYAWIFNSVNGDQGTLQGLLDNVCRGYDASGWP